MSSAAAALHRIRIINDASVSKSTKMTQFKFLIKKFDTLPTARNHCVPIEFTFNGHKWILGVYPGGLGVSANGYVLVVREGIRKNDNPVNYMAQRFRCKAFY